MKRLIASLMVALMMVSASAQTTEVKRVYDETINPLTQIDEAVARAKQEGKFVICQVGGNWCPWCLRFADFIERDTTIAAVVAENFEYIHVNYNPRKEASPELMKRLNNCGRFGFPVLVVLNTDGSVLHIQDSSFLEEGQGYNAEKVLRFFRAWTPEVVKN